MLRKNSMVLRSEPAPSARRRRTRDRLLGAALIVFARRGVDGAPIEELCEEAGMTRGAFYSNFSSIDELVVDLTDRAVEHTVAGIRGIIATAEGEYSVAHVDPSGEPEQRLENLRRSARSALSRKRLGWTVSIAWTITEAEIELHTIRNPDLRAQFLELRNAQFQTVGVEIGQLLSRHGARTKIPIDVLIRHLAATDRRVTKDAIPPRALELAPVPDASELVADTMSRPGEDFDASKLPEHSLLHTVERDLDPVIDLLGALVEFD